MVFSMGTYDPIIAVLLNEKVLGESEAQYLL